jgi:hypothetical protein
MVAHTLSYSNPEELRARVTGLAKAAGGHAELHITTELPTSERDDEQRPGMELPDPERNVV